MIDVRRRRDGKGPGRMHHFPTTSDIEQQESIPAEATDGLALENARLREAYLGNGQVAIRAAFAPYLMLTVIAASTAAAWSMIGSVGALYVGGWFAVVIFGFWLSYYRSLRAALVADSRTARAVSRRSAIVEAVGLVVLWSTLPAYVVATASGQDQIVIGSAVAAMMMASLALAAEPAAGLGWMVALVLIFLGAGLAGGREPDREFAVSFVLIAGLSAIGLRHLVGWMARSLKTSARTRTEGESIRLLLNEYEHRGVGWLWQVDAENRVVYISSRMTALLGRSTNQLIGHSLPASLGGSSALGHTLMARQPFGNLEMELKTRRGTRWISLSGDPIIDVTGTFQGFRGVGQDITDVRRTQERLTNLANMDVLSGLPNRGRVRQLLGEALSGSADGETPCAIMFLDLDGFKPVNDTFGHPKGDIVLKSVAQRLLKEANGFGQVGRMGGDEFAIVIKDANSRRMVETLADRLIGAIAEPFHIDKAEIRIGVSIGCAFGPVDGQSVDDLIQKADLALYQAKAQGRGTCCFFSSDMQSEAEERMTLEQDLRIAIKSKQFRLLYQPQIDVADQSLVGFEALIRWHHPTRGIVPPNMFIPLAEESGLIMELGEWVIQEACRAASAWPEHVGIAINVSARQLILPALPNAIRAAIRDTGLRPDRLELEVTESVFLGDSANAIEVLKQLREMGIGLALDDFGTGYSSLGYLNKAVFHKLKIDGSFVREAVANQETVAIIQSIVQLAKSFRMMVTAEGVETDEEFVQMRDLGCHRVQGFLFGGPMSVDKATALVTGLAEPAAHERAL
jgi:diguanylate cyclase (GGDEF)-like protein/PAS domain S-box-containing protein